MPAYSGTNIHIDLTIKIWRIPIKIKGTIEPVAIMKAFGEPRIPLKDRPVLRR